MQQEYKEIDLLDLFYAILKKWKLLVIITLVLALLGMGFGLIKSSKAKVPTKTDLKAIEATMTEEEISEVQSAASIIQEYRAMYNSQKSYNENSIYQNLDPFDIKTATLKYYVDNDYKISYPVISETNNLVSIVQTYVSVLSKDSIYERMSKEIDNNITPLYFSEMVSASTKDLQGSGLFVVTIMADTNERLDKMVAIVKDELSESTESISETYGDHSLTLAFESVQSEIISDVYDQQQLNIQKLTTITKAISDTEATFSGNQLTYLKGLVYEELEEEVSVVKYIAIGALLGFFVAVFVRVVKYLLAGTIKTPKGIESLYGVEVFGVVANNEEKSNEFDNWIASKRGRISSADDVTSIINAKIDILANKQSIKDLCFVIDGDYFEDVKDLLNLDGIKTCNAIEVQKDSKALQTMANSSAIVLIEKLDVSKTKDIEFSVNHAKQYEIPILGAIVIA